MFMPTIIYIEENVIIFVWYNLRTHCKVLIHLTHVPHKYFVFFKYESRGIPTPELINNNLSLADIRGQNMIDDTMYAVVHMATSYVCWEELERSFVMQFTLGHPKDCAYVVSVENITDPLFVFDDYGNDVNVGVLILQKNFLINIRFKMSCLIFVTY